MSATGYAVVDFGASPGNTDASIVVTGQSAILATSLCEAWIDATIQAGNTDHSVDEHAIFSAVAGVTCKNIVPGMGFTIEVAANMRVVNKFNLLWVWY